MAELMLEALSLASAELSVLLTDDTNIRRLNHEHRGKNSATDVLAYPLLEGDELDDVGEAALGDVVISLDTAQRQARARRHDLAAEVRFLLAHGLLHLVGYDHQTDADERAMNRRTALLVAAATPNRRRA